MPLKKAFELPFKNSYFIKSANYSYYHGFNDFTNIYVVTVESSDGFYKILESIII